MWIVFQRSVPTATGDNQRLRCTAAALMATIVAMTIVTSFQATETLRDLKTTAIATMDTAAVTSTPMLRSTCAVGGTSKLPANPLVIDYPAIASHPKTTLDILKQFTIESYEKYFMSGAGKEHYTLFRWLTTTYGNAVDCGKRHVVDIGTRYVASSLALSAFGTPVHTFDIPTSTERTSAFRGRSEEEWYSALKRTAPQVNITFHNLDLLQIPDDDFRSYMATTWLIVLDTHHLPYSKPFEREFMARLVAMQPRFEGIMLLDDIHLNDEMKQWWKELNDHAAEWGFATHNITQVGHYSGTGLLDFSPGQNVVIKEE